MKTSLLISDNNENPRSSKKLFRKYKKNTILSPKTTNTATHQ